MKLKVFKLESQLTKPNLMGTNFKHDLMVPKNYPWRPLAGKQCPQKIL